MANFKVEIVKRYGQFHATFFEASSTSTGDKQDPASFGNLDEVVGFVREQFQAHGNDGDEVIFRGIAYDNLGAVERQIRMSSY